MKTNNEMDWDEFAKFMNEMVKKLEKEWPKTITANELMTKFYFNN